MTVPTWWQDAVVYQIYPRSFADTNGDGIGDLPGVITKLDYLQWLGITTIWFSPFFPSPQFDVGYDVADYCDINPEYGTLADFDRLLAEAHQRGIRILLDLVLNHTSHEHQWFKESRSSRGNPKRDWYIWRDGQNGGPPNDWEAFFGGSAWEYDETTGQYYYCVFYPQQPDLNWRNPAVQNAMFDVVRFWLDRGVDGFRLDALGTLFENEDLPDSNAEISMADIMEDMIRRHHDEERSRKFMHKFRYQVNLPEVLTVVKRLRKTCDEYQDRILLGETEEVKYYGNGHNMLHALFNFDIPRLDALDPAAIRAILRKRLPTVPSGVWEANTVGNHDRPRSMSVYADGKHDRERARVALAVPMFLFGTPVFYNGEEIGMRSWNMPDIKSFRDNVGLWAYEQALRLGLKKDEALRIANEASRDKGRTPMQWANAPNAGFSPDGAKTWLPVNPDYAEGVNVADQRDDANSLLHTFRRMVQTRHDHIALRRGDFELVDGAQSGPTLAFWRRSVDETCFVALNMAAQPTTLRIEDAGTLHPAFSTHERSARYPLTLAPYEVAVFRQDRR